MSTHTYSRNALIPEYLRSGIGVLLTGGPLLLAEPSAAVFFPLGGLALLFAGYGLRTALRQASRLEVSTEGVRDLGPLGAAIRWDDLDRLELRFFSTQRSRRDGWMQLKLKGAGRAIKVDSTVSAFNELARVCALTALSRGVALDEHSRTNYRALGIELPADESAHGADAAGEAG